MPVSTSLLWNDRNVLSDHSYGRAARHSIQGGIMRGGAANYTVRTPYHDPNTIPAVPRCTPLEMNGIQ